MWDRVAPDKQGIPNLVSHTYLIGQHYGGVFIMGRKSNMICDYCGKDFYKRPSAIKKDKTHCCSKKCSSELAHKKRVKIIEDKFNEDIKTILHELYVERKLSTRKIAEIIDLSVNKTQEYLHRYNIPVRYGSEAVKTQWINNPERRKLSRKIAEEHLQTKEVRDKVRETMQTEEYRRKQSVSKMGEKNGMFGIYGENHPNWNPSLTDYERIVGRKTKRDVEWREKVYKRDNYTCVTCGDDEGRNLNAHHLYSHNKYKDKRYDINNGVTLCETCHKAFHDKYGYGNNTREQFNEFMNKKLALTI